jgi:hypothetical protein
MMIQVKYRSGKYDVVKTEILNRLLSIGEIDQFRRRSGWAKVGRDPIRSTSQGIYRAETERRQRDV